MRVTENILNIVSVFLIGVGCLIAITFVLPSSLLTSVFGGSSGEPQPNPAPVVENLAGKSLASGGGSFRGAGVASKDSREREKRERALRAPKSKMLRMTIPKMGRIKNDDIPTGKGTAKQLLHDHAAVHLEGTGFPWERNANVYMAGHRIGYPTTDSFFAFYDLNKLAVGDRVFLTDARDRRYTYRVFRVLVVEPTNISVTQPVMGRNILTLQTCTLPNYTQRLIVRAERISTEKVS